jgi:uncharacterized membrane protein
MSRFKTFIQTSVIGGFAVILPVTLFAFILKWLFKVATGIIRPLTNLVIARSNMQTIFADTIVIALILLACFLVGIVVKTKLGRFIQKNLEEHILKFAPGYSIIKQTVMQFLGKEKFPFSSVVLVRAYENDTLMTGFVTDEHPDGHYSVFVPSAPNPTTGFVFHLKRDYVHPVNVPAEEAIRSVISCGAGSGKLIKAYSEQASQT